MAKEDAPDVPLRASFQSCPCCSSPLRLPPPHRTHTAPKSPRRPLKAGRGLAPSPAVDWSPSHVPRLALGERCEPDPSLRAAGEILVREGKTPSSRGWGSTGAAPRELGTLHPWRRSVPRETHPRSKPARLTQGRCEALQASLPTGTPWGHQHGPLPSAGKRRADGG